MSNDPNQSGFGTQQFQKTQFAHKPHQEVGAEKTGDDVRARLKTPGTLMMITGAISLLASLGIMVFSLLDQSTNKDAWVQSWNQDAADRMLAEKQAQSNSFRNQVLSDDEEKVLAKKRVWNKNYYTIQMFGTAVIYFIAMVFATLFIVSGHKMKKLQGYKQSWVVAILMAVPCTSPMFLLSMPIGIWSIVVLKDPDVKKAFRAGGG